MNSIGKTGLVFIFVSSCSILPGCQTQDAKSAAYEGELTGCTLQSKTLCESIACENKVRARYGRPDRPEPAKCLIAPIVDAGADQ